MVPSLTSSPLDLDRLVVALDQRALTAVELAERTIEHLQAGVALHAVASAAPPHEVTAAAAAADARRSKGRARSAIEGVPYAAKDLFDVRGWVTSRGMPSVYRTIATDDSWLDGRLRRAGAIAVAKTTLDDLAMSIVGSNSTLGRVVNPLHPDHVTGGSSAGSAACVAAGIIPVATGTDTAGSISIPAAFCGVTGLKLTHDPRQLRGVAPLAPTLDQVGVIAATPAACRAALAAIGLRGPVLKERMLTIGLVLPADVDPETETIVGEAARRLQGFGVRVVERCLDGLDQAHDAGGRILLAAAGAEYDRLLAEDVDLPSRIRVQLERARTLGALEAEHRVCRAWRTEVRAAFEDIDGIWLPVTAQPAPRLSDYLSVRRFTRLTLPWNVAGLPTLSVPVGRTAAGLSTSALVVGPRRSEAVLLELGIRAKQAAGGEAGGMGGARPRDVPYDAPPQSTNEWSATAEGVYS